MKIYMALGKMRSPSIQAPNPDAPEHSDSPSEHNHPQSPPNLFAAPNPQRMSTTPLNDVPNLAEAIAMLANNLSSPKKSSPGPMSASQTPSTALTAANSNHS